MAEVQENRPQKWRIAGADEAMIYRRALKSILDGMVAANLRLKDKHGESVNEGWDYKNPHFNHINIGTLELVRT